MRGTQACLAGMLIVSVPAAAAADVGDYLGRPVTSVRLAADGRDTTDPKLLQMIETRVGRPFAMLDVRESIAHLYSLARFGAFAEPMSLQQSGNVVLMCLIGGGFASFYGPVLGVVVFLVLRDVFSTLTDHWMLLYGLLFMGIILFMPEGILGVIRRVRRPAGFHDTRAADAAKGGE